MLLLFLLENILSQQYNTPQLLTLTSMNLKVQQQLLLIRFMYPMVLAVEHGKNLAHHNLLVLLLMVKQVIQLLLMVVVTLYLQVHLMVKYISLIQLLHIPLLTHPHLLNLLLQLQQVDFLLTLLNRLLVVLHTLVQTLYLFLLVTLCHQTKHLVRIETQLLPYMKMVVCLMVMRLQLQLVDKNITQLVYTH